MLAGEHLRDRRGVGAIRPDLELDGAAAAAGLLVVNQNDVKLVGLKFTLEGLGLIVRGGAKQYFRSRCMHSFYCSLAAARHSNEKMRLGNGRMIDRQHAAVASQIVVHAGT